MKGSGCPQPVSRLQPGPLGAGDTHLSRLGATLGVGRKGAQATTWVSASLAYGWGKTVGFETEMLIPTLKNLRSLSFIVMLGSSAGF